MKVLVVSDVHGRGDLLQLVLQRETDCKTVFFLGDGESDIEKVKDKFRERSFVCVSGNNDFYSQLEETAYKYLEGHTVVACHGHRFSVRYDLYRLVAHAQDVRADVALYGHTHQRAFAFVSGVYCLNPGALCLGSYAVLTLQKNGVDAEFFSVWE